jgi:hypothetical protein
MRAHDFDDYKVLAVIGLLCIPLCLRFERLLPYAWLVTAYLILQRHDPVWYHHYLLLSIPLAWCAACGIAPITDLLRRGGRWSQRPIFQFAQVGTAAVALLFLLKPLVAADWLGITEPGRPLVASIPAKIERLRGTAAWLGDETAARTSGITPIRVFAVERTGDARAIEQIRANAAGTRWTFSDRPMYPFRAGLLCVPEMVVITKKRMAGSLTIDDILAAMDEYEPEQVILARLLLNDRQIRSYLRRDYTLEYQGRGATFPVAVHVRRMPTPDPEAKP